jgi:hypothetical protein
MGNVFRMTSIHIYIIGIRSRPWTLFQGNEFKGQTFHENCPSRHRSTVSEVLQPLIDTPARQGSRDNGWGVYSFLAMTYLTMALHLCLLSLKQVMNSFFMRLN